MIFDTNRPFVYIENVFDLWVQLIKNGGKNKSIAFIILFSVYINIYNIFFLNIYMQVFVYVCVCVYIYIYLSVSFRPYTLRIASERMSSRAN